MSLISIPYVFSAGAIIIASQHNSNFSTIVTDYNGNITNDNISGSASIAYSKLTLTGAILSTDLAGSIPDSKLSTISTAGKVSGAALTSLSSIPSGAGRIPVANLGTGATSSTFLRGDGAFISVSSNQLFNASGTFTAPSGITTVYLTMIGGGGGGAGATNGNMGGGGGSGAYSIKFPYTVVSGNSYTVTVGSVGAGGIGASNGGSGGTTTFDTVSVLGGSGGVNGSSTTSDGGAGGVVTQFTTTVAASTSGGFGFPGLSGARGNQGAQKGGTGAPSPFGSTSGGSGGNTTGTSATANTGCGGGGCWSNSASQTGGAGGTGFVLVEY